MTNICPGFRPRDPVQARKSGWDANEFALVSVSLIHLIDDLAGEIARGKVCFVTAGSSPNFQYLRLGSMAMHPPRRRMP